MELRAAGLTAQPFRTHGRPVAFVAYEGQERATAFLHETYEHRDGLGLFQGPSLAGKSTILRQFAEKKAESCTTAIIDGDGHNTTTLLELLLRTFGFEHKFDTDNELLNMLKVFVQQQTAVSRPPLLIIENFHAMNPSAMRVLCELSEVRVGAQFALRMILASDRSVAHITAAPAMECIADRLTGDFHLEPLTMDETTDYLYEKIRKAGCLEPQFVFSDEICDELHRASGGWPGILDRIALLAIATADHCPIRAEFVEHPIIPQRTRTGQDGDQPFERPPAPVLCLTHNGKTLKQLTFTSSRMLIGRSDFNDLCIDSRFVSRHHALLVRHGSACLLMDLNSVNGTFVNSRRVSNHVLRDADVVRIGQHGLKYLHPAPRRKIELDTASFNETVVMKSVEDMRRLLAREKTEILPSAQDAAKSGAD